MWRYRELIRNLTLANFKSRYQNTALGFLWSILSPFLIAIVLYLVFKNVFHEDENFAINLLVGIMAWRFFATGTTVSLYSIVANPSLVTKVYIPRKILTLSSVLANLMSSTLEFVILFPIIFVLTGGIPITILLFPLISLLFFWLIYSIGLILGALYVYLRDLNQILEVSLTSLFFLSPIIYPISIVPPHLIKYYMYNPITNFIIIYRDVMINGNLPSIDNLIVIVTSCIIIFLFGNLLFNKLQRRFAEAI